MIEVALLLSALSILNGINQFLLTSCSVFRRIVLESPHDSGYVVKWFKLPLLEVQHVLTDVYLIIHSSIPLFICDAIGVENTKKTPEISTACIHLCLPDVRVRHSHAKGRINKRSECKNLMFIFYINLYVFPDHFQPWYPKFVNSVVALHSGLTPSWPRIAPRHFNSSTVFSCITVRRLYNRHLFCYYRKLFLN